MTEHAHGVMSRTKAIEQLANFRPSGSNRYEDRERGARAQVLKA